MKKALLGLAVLTTSLQVAAKSTIKTIDVTITECERIELAGPSVVELKEIGSATKRFIRYGEEMTDEMSVDRNMPGARYLVSVVSDVSADAQTEYFSISVKDQITGEVQKARLIGKNFDGLVVPLGNNGRDPLSACGQRAALQNKSKAFGVFVHFPELK